MADLTFACDCGAVRGTLHDIRHKSGGQVQCHCNDCRRAIVWLGKPDPGPDGVRYFQTTPDHLTFTSGADTLQAFTWKNHKLLRWYAPCCNTSLFNTLDSPKWAFTSFMTDRMDDISTLPDVKAHAFMSKPNGKNSHRGMGGFIPGFVKRTIGARLSGRWRKTPLFDDNGTPRAQVTNLSHEDRATAQL